jgi:hypothetical protein
MSSIHLNVPLQWPYKKQLQKSMVVLLTTSYGGVCGYDTDIDKNEQIWQVRYNDGDISDYNVKELRAILVK